ncbi:MAG: hypothetical protein ACYCYI_08230 [Saccharofermentanales bacterium]
MKLFRTKILKLLTIFATLYFLSIPFIDLLPVRFIVVFIAAFLPYKIYNLHSKTRELQLSREQLKSLLEYLCTNVSSGKSIETVFSGARKNILAIYGKRAVFSVALKQFEDQMRSGIAFDDALLSMAKMLPCPEAQPLFQTIARTRSLGNRILNVLRQSLTMVSELLQVTKDISSDVSQKRLESAVMAAMPFVVLWSLELTTKSYLRPAFSNPAGRLLMLSAFLLSVASYCLGSFIVSRSIYRKEKTNDPSQDFSLSEFFSLFFIRFINSSVPRLKAIRMLRLLMPEDYTLSITRTLSYLYPLKENVFEEHLFIKISIIIFILLLYLILNVFMHLSFMIYLFVAAILIFLHDVDINGRINRNKILMMQDFPTFIGLLSTLLNNGIVLSKAIIMSTDTLKDSSVPFKNEIKLLRGSINSGLPCHEALEAFAARCQIPEIACALIFAAQFERTGSTENLNLLKLQCSICWAQSKTAARKQLDESSVKLLIPMVLQLICVMIITITPSVISLQITP